MRQEAARLGVTGWVRNLRDGSVKPSYPANQAVERMIAWAAVDRKWHGPGQVTVADGNFDRFEKLPTA
jgi:acylphosphatase